MDSKGLVSVIIPVYNVEQYLDECVQSVLCQTYRNLEIILVDDGSTDRSGVICDEYAQKDDRVRVIHKKNGGASSARNVGLDNAKGDYIYFLDSDDWLDYSALEKMLNPLLNSKADFSFCEAYAVDEKSGEVSKKNYAYHRDYGIDNSKTCFVEMLQNKEFHVAVWMILYRSAFLMKHAIRFYEGIMYEDCIFTFQVYRKADSIAHVHEYLYHRRYRKNSVMTSKKTAYSFMSAKRVYEEVVSIWEESGKPEYEKPFAARIAYNAISNYRALSIEERRKYKVEFLSIKGSIIKNKAFSDNSLLAYCYGDALWVLSKVRNKLLR